MSRWRYIQFFLLALVVMVVVSGVSFFMGISSSKAVSGIPPDIPFQVEAVDDSDDFIRNRQSGWYKEGPLQAGARIEIKEERQFTPLTDYTVVLQSLTDVVDAHGVRRLDVEFLLYAREKIAFGGGDVVLWDEREKVQVAETCPSVDLYKGSSARISASFRPNGAVRGVAFSPFLRIQALFRPSGAEDAPTR